MKKQDQNGKKLSLKKIQLSKISNMSNIHGGLKQGQFDGGDGDCIFPEDKSKPVDDGIKNTTL
ncbi:hypothetical protein [Chryseobacterium hagamense]|uniref:Uncharacterized protein n=1 Tax=Chryseobacterium hagamense TaxID=395935 RepID=A0A511YSP7_9FLAO|nr:hypothetical protein [Chryseobacterium hagamense]GEN78219.1 hypothetical protein CHA01nite_39590 [Chryseobacterium hagamense]